MFAELSPTCTECGSEPDTREHVPRLAKFGAREEMPGQPFSLANLRDTGEALYGRQWQLALAWDLNVQPRQQWFQDKPLADHASQRNLMNS